MGRPMPEVTCPQCRTRQPIEPDVERYRCVVCAATWNFVRCTVCGERYHTRPGTRAWTCPNCGTPHGRNRRGISSRGAPILPLLVLAILAIGAVVGATQLLGGDDAADRPSPTSPAPAVDPFDDSCDAISQGVQVLRVDALGRTADTLEADATALRQQGEDVAAEALDGVVEAIHQYQEVAQGGGDTQAATDALLDSLDAVDWC
jgi:hypothetical protein